MPAALDWLTSALACSVTPEALLLERFEIPDISARCTGRAFTVRGAAGDNLALWHAIEAASRGDVLVADVDGHVDTAHWGEMLSTRAMRRGIAGIVINGAVRDRAQIAELGFPVFHRGVSPRKPAKVVSGAPGDPVRIDDHVIHTRDLVIADADGVVVIPDAAYHDAVAAAISLRHAEERLLD